MAKLWNVTVYAFLIVPLLSGCSLDSYIEDLRSGLSPETPNRRDVYQAQKISGNKHCLDGKIKEVYSNQSSIGVIAGNFSGIGECVKDSVVYSIADDKFYASPAVPYNVEEKYFLSEGGGDYLLVNDRRNSSAHRAEILYQKNGVRESILAIDGSIGWAQKVGDEIFFVGRFTEVLGEARQHFAVYNVVQQSVQPLVIPINLFDGSGIVDEIQVLDDYILLDGFIESVGATTVNNGLVIIRRSDSFVRVIPFESNWFTYSYAIHGDSLIIGGAQMQPNYSFKSRIREFNLATGVYEAWEPVVDGENVRFLKIVGDKIILGGSLRSYEGQPVGGFVKVDLVSRALEQILDSEIAETYSLSKFIIRDDFLYGLGFSDSRGGFLKVSLADFNNLEFTEIPGMLASSSLQSLDSITDGLQMRGSFSAVFNVSVSPAILAYDFNEDAPLGWEAPVLSKVNAQGVATSRPEVTALVGEGDWIYIAGRFNRVDGQPSSGLVSLNLKTGEVQTWDLGIDLDTEFGIRNMALSGNRLYIQGEFAKIQGQGTGGIVALDIKARKLVPTFLNQINAGATDFMTVLDGNLLASGEQWVQDDIELEGAFAWNLQSGQYIEYFPMRIPGVFRNNKLVYIASDKLCLASLIPGRADQVCSSEGTVSGQIIGEVNGAYIYSGYDYLAKYALTYTGEVILKLNQGTPPAEAE